MVVCTGVSLHAATNALTPQEKSEGWILLFDGESMKGWVDPASKRLRAMPGPWMTDA